MLGVCYLSSRYLDIRLNAFLFAMLVNFQMLVWLPLRSSHLPPPSLAAPRENHNRFGSSLDSLPAYPGSGPGLTWSIVVVELFYLGGEIFFKLRLKELCRISKQIGERWEKTLRKTNIAHRCLMFDFPSLPTSTFLCLSKTLFDNLSLSRDLSPLEI